MLPEIKCYWLKASGKCAVSQEKRRRRKQENSNIVNKQLLLDGKEFPSLIDVSLDDLIAGLQDGLFTSYDLVDTYIARINEVNSLVCAVTEINPDAREIATQLDLERQNGKIRGPLHGVPILIKNNIATHDLMNNTAGSYALLGAKVPRDATVAANLRASGAIILGKANLSQWANFRSKNSSSGWSAHGGQVYGVYYPKQDPTGSSSGSGVSAALGLSLAALGTETDGSILSPASVSNVVGIKPTVGLTSRYLCIPISEHQDSIGSMARYVKDAAYLLQAIAGRDERDPWTREIPNDGKLPDYVAACKGDALHGARIGIPRNVIKARMDEWSGNKQMVAAFEEALAALRSAGATLIEDTDFTALDEILKSEDEMTVLYSDMGPGLAAYLAELSHNPFNITTLSSLRDWTRLFLAEEYPSRDTGRWDDTLAKAAPYDDARFKDAYAKQIYFGNEGGLVGALDRHALDAVVLPARMAPKFAAGIGAPVISVPMGAFPAAQPLELNDRKNLVDSAPNVPFGLAFLGRKWSEETLIGLAYAFEQVTRHRDKIRPYLYPTIELKHIVSSSSPSSSPTSAAAAAAATAALSSSTAKKSEYE